MRTGLRGYLALLLVTLVLTAGAAKAAKWSPEYEQKVGTEAATEAEKVYKVAADEEATKRLNEMAAILARVSDRPDVVYTVKLLESDEVNAFSLPGGFIYVTKGLLADAQSDHEIAGVIAHEIAHNCGYDGLNRAEKDQKLFMGSLAAALTAVLLGGGTERVNAVLQAGEFTRMGVLSHYSMDLERRADRRAVRYLCDSKTYNPVGLLTFMERLAARERREPRQELGIYADHPDSSVRVSLITGYLEDADVEINRRAVTKWEPPQVADVEVDGVPVPTLSLWGSNLLQTTHAAGAASATERLTTAAGVLREHLAAGLEAYEVDVEPGDGSAQVLLRGQPWLTIYPEDVRTAGSQPLDVARQVAAGLSTAFAKERLDRWY